MQHKLIFTEEAEAHLKELENDGSKKAILKAVKKALGYLSLNPHHPSLNTHEFHSLSKQYKQKIFEAYAQNHTPGAYRIFWHYGPEKGNVTIIAITPHP